MFRYKFVLSKGRLIGISIIYPLNIESFPKSVENSEKRGSIGQARYEILTGTVFLVIS